MKCVELMNTEQRGYPQPALLSLYIGSMKDVLWLYEGSMKAVLRRYYGAITALLRLYEGFMKANDL